MAYQSSVAALEPLISAAIANQPSSGAEISKGGAGVYRFCSSHSAVDIAATAFFSGCGAQPKFSSGLAPYQQQSRSPNAVGVRVGDLLVNVESSAGAAPGRVSWHCAVQSSYGSASSGWDVSVSPHAST